MWTGSKDGSIRLWDVRQGRELRRLEAQNRGVTCLLLSPDGKALFSAGLDYQVPVLSWDTNTGNKLTRFGEKYEQAYLGLALSPDGKSLAGANSSGYLRVWERATGNPLQKLEKHGFNPRGLEFADNGQVAARDDAGTLRLWNVINGKLLAKVDSIGDGPDRFAVAPSHKVCVGYRAPRMAGVAKRPPALVFHSWPGGESQFSWDLPERDEITQLAFAPNGKVVWFALMDGRVCAFEAAKRSIVKTFTGPTLVTCLTVSPDGARVASGYSNGNVLIWDVRVEAGKQK